MVCVVLDSSKASAADLQMWDEIDVAAPVSTGIEATLPLVIRDSLYHRNPQLLGVGAVGDIAIDRLFVVSAGYLYVRLPDTGPGFDADVPLVAASVAGEIGRLRISDRNRLEQLFGLPKSPIRYRNKLSFDIPSDDSVWKTFATDESFYDFSRSTWTQNRFQIGVARRISQHATVDFFYLEKTDLLAHVDNAHVMGFSLEVNLERVDHADSAPHTES